MRATVVFILVLAGCMGLDPQPRCGEGEANCARDTAVPVDDTGPTDTDTDTDPSTDPDTGDDLPCEEIDADEDGFNACVDCDDNDPLRYPGAPERCNGVDDDCDGVPAPGEQDLDGDGAPDCTACEAAGYWEAVRDLSGQALLDELADLVKPQTCSGYSATTTWMFTVLDKDPVTNQVECVYTGRKTTIHGNQKPDHNTDMNTEHTWPQSQGAGSEPARCDLHHLHPSDTLANSRRGNHPFGHVVSATWSEGGSALGTNAQGQTVFEPRDAKKGDIARGMVYFAHRYGHSLSAAEQSLYRSWHALDPVDDYELERSMAIAGHQVLANPFVVCREAMDAF